MANFPTIELYQGDTYRRYFKIKTPALAAANLSGYRVLITAKTLGDYDAGLNNDTTAVLKHGIILDGAGAPVGSPVGIAVGGVDPDTGSSVSGAASGVITWTISASDSASINPDSYVWDLEVMDASGFVRTLYQKQSLVITRDVTKRSTIT